MFKTKKMAKGLIVTTVCLGTFSSFADTALKDFRVCKPYQLEVRALIDNVNNFESTVLAPLERELSERSSRVRHRASDESKLETVVRDIKNTIARSEARLTTNPSTIEANKRAQTAARQEISKLENEIAELEVELEDAGFIKRPIIRKKIKNRKKDIKREEERIIDLQNANIRLAEEMRSLPGKIQADRQRLVTAEGNLSSLQNRVPTLRELRARELEVRQRLDSQEDIEANLRFDLKNAERDFAFCRRVDENAKSYVALKTMVKLLKGAHCDVNLVRNRLPYDVTKLELRALAEAEQMVCAPVPPINQ